MMDKVDGISLHSKDDPFKVCPTMTSNPLFFEVGDSLPSTAKGRSMKNAVNGAG